VLLLPATSKACTWIVFPPTLSVSEQPKDPPCRFAGAPLQVTPEIPDKASDTLPVTVMAEAETVVPLTGDVILSVGGVLSRLIVRDAGAVFPAASVAVPEIS
jgi:hypothetical protein